MRKKNFRKHESKIKRVALLAEIVRPLDDVERRKIPCRYARCRVFFQTKSAATTRLRIVSRLGMFRRVGGKESKGGAENRSAVLCGDKVVRGVWAVNLRDIMVL